MVDVVDSVAGRLSASAASDVPSNNSLLLTAVVFELQTTNDRFVVALSSVSFECDNRRFLTQEQGIDIINLRVLLDTSKRELKLLERQFAFVQNEKKAVAPERFACNAKVSGPQTLFRRYQDAYIQVSRRLNEEDLRSEAGCMAPANKSGVEVSSFLRGLAISMKDFVGQHIARARASGNEHSSTIVGTTRSVENELQDIVSEHSILADSLLDNTRFITSRDVLVLL